ncbi:M50 family metallopeptidase [Pontixanthobacter aquaemixtae]|uniref:M50 family peptidase n=1 Tax=Pontixanthobacter aquaemixtae TaxID=1958940 RepID=A0A844ZUU5_9SPHN|nr:M50 family metallopeptidase [Pontixanthobacter aquaemixtae]MXO91645.1 M50 family peptidase [Pontixanthobacter aquaemixtae]
MRDKLSGLFRRPKKYSAIEPAKFGASPYKPAKDHPGWLALAALAVIILPKLPLGNYITYPFFILTTWFHEMGHGLTAILLGLDFYELVIFANGNGYAMTGSPPGTWPVTEALVSAGGPLGPAIAGSLMILASTKENMRRLALTALGGVIIITTAIWVRSVVGWAVLLPTAVLILFIAQKGSEAVSRFAVQFLGIHAAVSMFGQWGYLFSTGAVIGGVHQNSDTGAIAEELLLAHWFWAGAIIAAAALMLGASLYRVLVKDARR